MGSDYYKFQRFNGENGINLSFSEGVILQRIMAIVITTACYIYQIIIASSLEAKFIEERTYNARNNQREALPMIPQQVIMPQQVFKPDGSY